jgi:hypothetical protein
MHPKGDPKGGRPFKDPAGPAKIVSFRLSPSLIEMIRDGADRLGIYQADLLDASIRAYLADH